MDTIIKVFQEKEIRSIWLDSEEKWYFSIIDIISILTESPRPRKYWNALKTKLGKEGSQLSLKMGQLKLLAEDGKYRFTDVADIEQIFRLIQSIPSKKIESLKLWLAEVGRERIDEVYDPELIIDRAMETYRKKGYSEEWVNQRLKSIEIRKDFTDELKRGGINSNKDFAILTDVLTKTWSGYSVKEYKKQKNLTKSSLRDNMSNMEIVLNMLAETSSTELSKIANPKGYKKVKEIVKQGASVAKVAKDNLKKIVIKK